MFREVLQKLVAGVPGATAAMVMGADGIPLDEFRSGTQDGVDLQTLAVEYSTLIRDLRGKAASMGAEGLEELSVRTANGGVIIRIVNDEYFAMLTLQDTGYAGKGRYLLRHACEEVLSQL